MAELVFLKLGGSLITDKTRPYTPRLDKLAELAAQIAAARAATPSLRLLLGHGSGSFGHSAAEQHGTREGLPHHPPFLPPSSPKVGRGRGAGGDGEGDYWRGFAEVWYQAGALNRLVMNALHQAGGSAIAFPPSACVTAGEGAITAWDLTPLRAALEAGLLPVVYGDVVFDERRGGAILSTEDLFLHLARHLRPDRILLAGLEAGVWADYPARTRRLRKISPASFERVRRAPGRASGQDVTGGMESKVRQMLALVTEMPALRVQIFSAEQPGDLARALAGEPLGTLIIA